MTKLHDLYRTTGPEPLARQPAARLDHRAASWPAGSSGACGASRPTPRSSRRRSPAPTSTTTSSATWLAAAPRSTTPTGPWSPPTSRTALRILRPVHDESGGVDGFVSLEVAPDLARDTDGTVASARDLHDRIDEPNLFVKVPATAEGVEAIRTLIGEGRSINVTLIFGLDRYDEVMEAYLSRGWRPTTATCPGRQRGVVLREPGRHRGRPAARGHRHARGPGPAGQGGGGPGPGGLPVRRDVHRPPLGGAGRPGRPRAAPAVGVDVDQERRLPRHALRRHADRARHGQHHARGHPRGLRGPRHAGPHGRRRPRRRPGDAGRPRRGGRRPRRRRPGPRGPGRGVVRQELRRADDLARTPRPKTCAAPVADRTHRHPRAVEAAARRQPSGGRRVHGELVVVDDVPGEFAERVIEAFHGRPHDGFSLAVSGGDLARRCYERLADDAGSQIDWWKVDVYWGDERCVPLDDERLELPAGPRVPARAGGGGQRQLPDALRGGARPLPAAPGRAGPHRRGPPGHGPRRPHRLAVPRLARPRRRPRAAGGHERGPVGPQPVPPHDAHARRHRPGRAWRWSPWPARPSGRPWPRWRRATPRSPPSTSGPTGCCGSSTRPRPATWPELRGSR